MKTTNGEEAKRPVGRSQFRPGVSSQQTKSSIDHVRYINILAWLRGFRVKRLYLVLFSLFPSLFWELKDKRNFKN